MPNPFHFTPNTTTTPCRPATLARLLCSQKIEWLYIYIYIYIFIPYSVRYILRHIYVYISHYPRRIFTDGKNRKRISVATVAINNRVQYIRTNTQKHKKTHTHTHTQIHDDTPNALKRVKINSRESTCII
jgi:hypothetical protein